MMRTSSILAVIGTALLLATSAAADGATTSLPEARTTSLGTPEVCRFPFFYENTWWNTCVTMKGATGENAGKPMCVLKNPPPAPANNWLFCDMAQFNSTPSIIDSAGTKHDCVPQNYNGSMFLGCYYNGNAGDKLMRLGNFKCMINSETKEEVSGTCAPPGPNRDLASGSTAKTGLAAGGPSDDDNSNPSNPAVSAGGVIAIVASTGLVALLAGLFVYRRRQSRQDESWQYQDKDGNQMGTASGTGFGMGAGTADYRKSSATGIFTPVSPGERLYPVISTYAPTLGDELEIQPGDKVSILIEYDDGWCQGINHTRGGLKGVFPRHCVDMTATMPVDGTQTADTSAMSFSV